MSPRRFRLWVYCLLNFSTDSLCRRNNLHICFCKFCSHYFSPPVSRLHSSSKSCPVSNVSITLSVVFFSPISASTNDFGRLIPFAPSELFSHAIALVLSATSANSVWSVVSFEQIFSFRFLNHASTHTQKSPPSVTEGTYSHKCDMFLQNHKSTPLHLR